ncbi:hypothetical protein SFRURICE_013905 [Spodoptera frugiperda]|uniref:SFRICE_001879 n=1 Tax=Spodoptera frugiperda TaxID=7108 RepID=A0A2H1V5M5_SPOFR|nr:hypothetical protein SFRURICE_013905 [Spodoptera frugiperda]
MVVTKSKKKIGFNSTCERFGRVTGHPNLDPSGLYATRPDGCDPCLYSPIPIHLLCEATHKHKIDKDPWRYKNELEEWAKNLGYRNQKILEQRQWTRSLLGPAWHEVNEVPKYEPACKNVGFGRTPRFKPMLRHAVPDPGAYYKSVPFKAPYGPHSSRPTFEREEPCRFKDTTPKWCLASNRYTIIDKDSIDQKSKKVISIRGPYDLFTGKRDESTIKNHFNTSLKCSAASWPIALKGSLEKYKTSHFGKLNKTNRSKPYRGRNILIDLAMCPRRPQDPGPTRYITTPPYTFKQYRHGFNSSYDRPPGYKKVVVWPGVGRYKFSTQRSIAGNGHKHVFLSKIERTIGAVIIPPMNTF